MDLHVRDYNSSSFLATVFRLADSALLPALPRAAVVSTFAVAATLLEWIFPGLISFSDVILEVPPPQTPFSSIARRCRVPY